MNFPLAHTELETRTSAVLELAAALAEASENFTTLLHTPDHAEADNKRTGKSAGDGAGTENAETPDASPDGGRSQPEGPDLGQSRAQGHPRTAGASPTPEVLKRQALEAVRVLERAQVQVEAAMHLAAGVALSVEAEEQERLLDLPLDEKIGRGKGGHGGKRGNGSGRGKHQDAFTVTPPTNANARIGSAPVTGCGVGSVDPCATTDATTANTARDAGTTNPTGTNPTGTDSSSTANATTSEDSSSTSADPASSASTGFPRGSAFFPGFDSRDVEDSEVAFPRVWCGVSVKAMDEALWGLGSELALLWGRSEFVTTGMLIDTATLSRLPKLEARFITGLLNSRLVKTAVKHCVGLTDEQASAYDARLHEFMFPAKYDVTGQYPVRSANDVAKFAEVTRNRLHAEPLAVRERREMKHRYVSITNEANGMCTISGLLPATAAHRFMNTLTDFAITAKTQNDTRTLKQLIADVFTDLITHNYNQSYPNTPPNPARPDGTGATGGTEGTSAPTSGPAVPDTAEAEGTSVPGTDSGPAAGTGSCPPRDQEPADADPGGSAPTERLSYDSVHELFNHTTTPETGFQGTTAPETGGEGTSVPDSGNGSAPDTDPGREECYWVDPDGVIHDHPRDGDASVQPDTRNGAEASEATCSAGGAEPETASGSRSGLRGEAKIFVTIPATSLAGLDEQDGMLSGYGPITADAIRELAGTAHTLYRMFVDPDTGRPLALGRSSYRVDTQLREFLQLRSDTCQFPGCGVNARRTDADHIHEWDTGGETNPENLQLLCRKHHNLKTHHDWEAKVLDPETGTIQWTSPLGNTYITEPSGINTSGTGGRPDAHHHSEGSEGNRSDPGTNAGNDERAEAGSSRDPWGMTPEENATTDFSDAPF